MTTSAALSGDRRPSPSLATRMVLVACAGPAGLVWAAADVAVSEPPSWWRLLLVAVLLAPALLLELPLRLGERRLQVAGLSESAYLVCLVLLPTGWLVLTIAVIVSAREWRLTRGTGRSIVNIGAWVGPVALGTAVFSAVGPEEALATAVTMVLAGAVMLTGNELLVCWMVAAASRESWWRVLRENATTTAIGFAGNLVLAVAVLAAVAGERWELLVVGPVVIALAVRRYRGRLSGDTTADALPRLREAARRVEALDEDRALKEVLDRAAALFAVERVQLVLPAWPGRGDQTRTRTGPGAVETVEALPQRELGPHDIVVPLLSGGLGVEVLLGELRLTFTRPPSLSQAEHDVLRTFAATTAAALGHTRSYAEQVHRARVDALTGLPNRLAMAERLEQLLPGVLDRHEADPGSPPAAVLLLDLDHFKEVNDSLGHGAGDDMLIQLAGRLSAALRPGDLAVRLGGDEFGVLLPSVRSGRDALAVAEKLLGAINVPVTVEGLELPVEASVGVALAPRDGTSMETLLRCADVAMYRAKAKRNSAVVYDPVLDPSGEDRLRLVAELQTALKEQRLVVLYQPVVSLRTGELRGAEALVRWNHPTRGMLTPGEFIPAIERTSLILPLTLSVLDQAVRDAVTWTQPGGPERGVSVNLSPRCLLVRSLPVQVAKVLVDHGLPARRLTLEITESLALVDLDVVDEVLTALRDLGVRLSVDDFGTGFSSMSFLRKVAVHEVKIDRSFVAGASTSPGDRAIVQGTVALAHGLGLTVVAEGVETPAQLRMLRDSGCDAAQGYLMGRPVPAAELAEMLRRPDPSVLEMTRVPVQRRGATAV